MAAGLGFKEFTTGDVLTAADANGYLASQVVMVFASAAARTSAIASPQEGMISYLKDTDAVQTYSGAAWVSVGGAAGGKVLQVVSGTYSTATVISSTTFTDSGLSVSITPTSATSKVLVMVLQGVFTSAGDRSALAGFQIVRDSTVVWAGGSTTKDTYGILGATASDYERLVTPLNLTYLDSPATTSATTYKTQGAVENTANSADVRFQWQSVPSQMILMEIGA